MNCRPDPAPDRRGPFRTTAPATPPGLVGQVQPHHLPDNDVLRCRVEPDRVVVASSGIPQEGCGELREAEALVIDRTGLASRARPALTV